MKESKSESQSPTLPNTPAAPLPLEVLHFKSAPAQGFALQKRSRSRFGSKSELTLELLLQNGAPARGLAPKQSSRSRFCSKTELPLEVWLQIRAPAQGLTPNRISRLRFCSKTKLPLEVWLEIRAPARGLAPNRSSRSSFVSQYELPLELWPYFARLRLSKHSKYHDLVLKHNNVILRQLCLCIVLTCLSFLRNHCTALHLSLHF